MSIFFAAVLAVALINFHPIYDPLASNTLSYLKGWYRPLYSGERLQFQRQLSLIAFNDKGEAGFIRFPKNVIVVDYAMNNQHRHVFEFGIAVNCFPDFTIFSPAQSNSKRNCSNLFGSLRRDVCYKLGWPFIFNVGKDVSVAPIADAACAIIRNVHCWRASRIMEGQSSLKFRHTVRAYAFRKNVYLSPNNGKVSLCLRLTCFSRLVDGTLSGIRPPFSLFGGVSRVQCSHSSGEQGCAADKKAEASNDQLAPSPSRSVVSGVRSFPLSAKIGSALVLAPFAACVWVVGAKRSYERGKSWWRGLLGSLLGGWALLLSAVALIGLSGPY